MKAIVYQEFGNVDVLQMAELSRPAIQSGEVLIRVKAFSINPMDWKIRKGGRFRRVHRCVRFPNLEKAFEYHCRASGIASCGGYCCLDGYRKNGVLTR